MSATTLAIAGAISVATGVAFALVARAVSRQGVASAHLLARRAHMTWWLALGAYLVLQGALTLAASADRLTLDMYLASRAIAIPLLCASVWGISSFMAYLYWGEPRAATGIGIFYALVAALFFYVTFGQPQTLVVNGWVVGVQDDDALYRLVYALVGIPPILASLMYLRLMSRADAPEKRYRIALVAGSILLYVGSGLAARLSSNDVVIFVTLVLLGLGAAAASLAAFYPPRPVRAALERRGRA